MSNDYLNMVNSQLKEASQWIKDYKANPEKYGSATAAPSSSTNGNSSSDLSQLQQLLGSGGANSTMSNMMGMFQSMMMLMMFQILAQQMGTGAASNAFDTSKPPIPVPYHPIQTAGNTSTNSSSQDASSTSSNSNCPAGVNTLKDILATTDTPAQEDLESFATDWTNAGLNETQLGQSVMYLMHQGDDASVAKLEKWLPGMFQTGLLNSVPFMNSTYLDKLSDDRLLSLSNSIANTGCRYADNSAQTAMLGQLFTNLSEDSDTPTSAYTFSQDLLYRLWEKSPQDDVLANIFALTGFSQSDDGGIQGPFELESQYATATV